MALSIALIILAGLIANLLFTKIKLPGLLGMILVGVIAGPFVLNIIQPELLSVSKDFREVALIIILLRAGFTMNKEKIKRVGWPALLLSFVPAVLEIIGVMIFGVILLNLSILEAAILGSILSAVSPAVVVPYMIEFEKKKLGTNKAIPSLMISASSIDDVFVIIIFTALIGMYSGQNISIIYSILSIPISIIIGLFLGAILGVILVKFFKKYHMRDTVKVMIIISIAIILSSIQDITNGIIPFSSLLAIMAIGIVMLEKYSKLVIRMSPKFEKIWVGAQILLFVLIGSQVNISVAFDSGLRGLAVIFSALVLRSFGVIISLIKSGLNIREKLFCIISYIPKATVQAAIGAIPLAYGMDNGDIILAVAVLSIITTAPLGAIGIKLAGPKLLTFEIIKNEVGLDNQVLI